MARLEATCEVDLYSGEETIPHDEMVRRVAGKQGLISMVTDAVDRTVIDAGAVRSLFGLEILTEPVAVVIGAEGAGLSTLAAKRCDVLASIPMAAGVESLNASVSAALACFEVLRVRAGA